MSRLQFSAVRKVLCRAPGTEVSTVSQPWQWRRVLWQLPGPATTLPSCQRRMCVLDPVSSDDTMAASVTRLPGQAGAVCSCKLAVAITSSAAVLQGAAAQQQQQRDLDTTNSKQRPGRGPGLLPSPGYFPITNRTYTLHLHT